jgi:hypothetical protein
MTTMSLSPAATAASPGRALGLLLLAEALLSFAPVVVLGSAIGWPASLGRPAADQLEAIAAAPDAVALGYLLYLLYSVLVAPLMIWLASRVFGSLASPLAATVAAFAALSTLARAIGILRWLTVMPALASAHAGADPASRLQIELVFGALTAYGGGIGELLGVSLFMALSLALLCAGGWRQRTLPAWLAISGALSALLLAAMPLGLPAAAAVTGLTLWMAAAGVWCLRR